jgi:dipeptidyl aminopeptidase/acylaminoacyl peptidase
MKRFGGVLLAAAMGLAAHVAHASDEPRQARPALIPTEELSRLPDIANAMLSPDGTSVAFLGRVKGRQVIAYRPIDQETLSRVDLPEKVDFRWMRWAGNDKLLISVGRGMSFMGIEISQSALILHDFATKSNRLIGEGNRGLEGDDVLFVDPEGRYLLLSMQADFVSYPSVFRVSLSDGQMTEVVKRRAPVMEWFADDAGVVRAGFGYDGGKFKFFYRSTEAEKFEMIAALRPGDENADFEIAKIGAGSDEGYVLSDKQTGRQALYRFNYRTRQIGELVYGNDNYDIDRYWLNADGTALEGVAYTDDRERVEWFDTANRKLQSQIDQAIPGRQAWMTSRSRDGKLMLIFATAPDEPGVFYLLDRKKGEMSPIASMQQSLDPDRLAPTKAVRYQARDGLTIPAYLTLPKGREAKKLPLIIYPHGGPYGVRDKLAYDADIQFLANRGYAVLQPNYRGSGGYGTVFGDAGIGQLGRKMQDDLDDGMDWLVKDGIVDSGRVCVIGASYGGYAALWAVIRNPERYRCAASFAGVSDLKSILRYNRRFLTQKAGRRWQERVRGDSDFDLETVSPTQQAVRLDRPVLIAHGEDDSIVPVMQSKSLVAALKAAGKKNFEYIAYPKEGHGFSDPANRKDWFDRLDAFLAKHNPAE